MTSRARPSHGGAVFAIVLLCFLGSGATGLVYQVLWVRLLERVVGGAPFAIAIVLAVFMGGLGFGSWLASRWIDRAAETAGALLRAYGLLELGIGLCALLVPPVLVLLHPAYAWLYRALAGHLLLFNLATCIVAAVVLLLPTTLMGATLPLLCRYAVSDLQTLGRRTGLLYGLNTLGAAIGALLAGWLLLPWLGVNGTLWLAVAVNAVIGVTGLGLARGAASGPGARRARAAATDGGATSAGTGTVYTLMAVSGFTTLASEVILTRLLSLIVGPTTYSLTVVLVTFITGLAIGGVVFGRLGDRTARPDLMLLWSQLGAALSLLLCGQLLGDSQLFFAKLLFTFQQAFGEQQLLKGAALLGFMLLPTVCLGGTFPLAGKLLASSPDTVGRALGRGYAISTAGCVLGSVVAGFLLLPLAGKERGLSLVVAFQLLTVAAVALTIARGRPRQRAALTALAAVGLLGSFLMPRWNHVQLASSKYHRFAQLVPAIVGHGWLDALVRGPTILGGIEHGQLLYYGEGIGGFTTVLRTTDVLGNPELSLANSGKFDASSVGDMKTQVLSAQVPLLTHPHPERVMVLGLASGVTGGEVLRYPSVTRLDILEIAPQVVPAARLFREFNGGVLEDPRTHLILQDARAHLGLGGANYDVIISEPSNPWMAGMASLFTREFFALARQRLRPGGLYVQFIHRYEIDWPSFSLVVRTFADVFPDGALMATNPSRDGADYLLIGFADAGGHLDFDVPPERRTGLAASGNFRLSDPALLYRMVVAEDLPALAGPGPVNTEDRPLLEFAAPRQLYATDLTIPIRIGQQGRLTATTARRARELEADPAAALAFADFALSLRAPFAGMELTGGTGPQRRQLLQMIGDYSERYQTDCSLFRDRGVAEECLQRQAATLEARKGGLDAGGMAYLGDLHLQLGRTTEAREELEGALALDGNTLLALNDLGILLGNDGKYLDAINYFERAAQLNPLLPQPYINLGMAYLGAGDRNSATRKFRAALELDPGSSAAREGLQRSAVPNP